MLSLLDATLKVAGTVFYPDGPIQSIFINISLASHARYLRQITGNSRGELDTAGRSNKLRGVYSLLNAGEMGCLTQSIPTDILFTNKTVSAIISTTQTPNQHREIGH